MLRLLPLAAVLLAFATRSLSAQEPSVPQDVRLTLPPLGYAIAGAEMSVYFDNIVLTQHPEKLRFVVSSDLGKVEANRWTVTPGTADVGDHAWKIAVFDGEKPLAEQSMTWHVAPASAGAGRNIMLLIVGDSLTHATIYPNDLARRLSEPGMPAWTMLGTHRPASTSPAWPMKAMAGGPGSGS